MTKHSKFKQQLIPVIVTVGLFLLLMLLPSMTVQAAPQHGFGQGQGRTDTINENDFHTSAWDRFSFNYQFTSGSDHRFELGRPTTFNGFVPVDVFSVNMRRDANVSLRPPVYGIFSGNFPTDPTSRFFPQPVNPHFHQPFMLESTALDPRFDTLQQGVNAPPIGNPMNFQQNESTGEFLPSTSIRN
jgi:hypothetical protein